MGSETHTQLGRTLKRRLGKAAAAILMVALPHIPATAAEDCDIDLESGVWSDLANLPIDRHENATAKLAIGTAEYIFYFAQKGNGTVVRYDISSNVWATSDDAGPGGAPPLRPLAFSPPSLGDHKKAFTIGRKIYIVGGTRPFDAGVWSYDGINPPLQMANIGCSGADQTCTEQLNVGAFAAAIVGGQIYTAGGHCNTSGADSANCTCNGEVGGSEGDCAGNATAPGENTDRAFRYDPIGDDWFPIADLPIAVDHASGAAFGGKFYVIGGRQCGTDTACEGRTHTQIYDPASDTWSFGAALPQGCSGMGHAAVMNGRIYLFGGEGGACTGRAAQEYDPLVDSWRMLTGLDDTHHGMTPIVIGTPGDGVPDRILLGSGRPLSSTRHLHQFEFTCEPKTADCSTNADCDDGLFCNGTETCDAPTGCVLGAAPTTDDGVGCTIDECDEMLDVITHTTSHALCDDGDYCNGVETCHLLEGCRPGTAPALDDGIGCTLDSCDEVNDAVTHLTANHLCDDGVFCNGIESCNSRLGCLAGAPTDCNTAESVCAVATCDEATQGCVEVATNEGDDCDDGNLCTTGDSCRGGICSGASYCGVPLTRAANPAVTDALLALRATVGLAECPVCECDVNASGATTVADALMILAKAVNLDVSLDCFVAAGAQ